MVTMGNAPAQHWRKAMTDPCPDCHGEGFTKAPYMLGLKTGDLYTITICACGAGQSRAAQIAAMATKIPEDE